MRETFSSSSGFALAAIGSAVGLGNMWRFSYLTSLLGVLFVVPGFLILSYYSVVAGWTARYGWESLVGSLPDNPASHFEQISQGIHAVI